MLSGLVSLFSRHIVLLQGAGSVLLLCGFIVATTMLQQRALKSSTDVLQTVTGRVQQTTLYGIAMDFLKRRQSSSNLLLNPVHAIPIWFLIIVVFFCSVISYFGAEAFTRDQTPSYVLGGALASSATVQPADLARFQSQTVFIGVMAFFGAYVWVIATLVMRINNYDTSPITFYFLSVRILTACLVAGIARQMFAALPFTGSLDHDSTPVWLAVLGFLIGWNPTLWINELLLRAADYLKQRTPVQRIPQPNNMPQNMTLSMIQGLLDDKIARLAELDVDNCQKLACENAILIWLRTPYNLDLIVDWIAQAQLALLFEPDQLENLRKSGVRDIFSYLKMLSDEGTRRQIQTVANIPLEIVTQHSNMIADDPKFRKLEELRIAIGPG